MLREHVLILSYGEGHDSRMISALDFVAPDRGHPPWFFILVLERCCRHAALAPV